MKIHKLLYTAIFTVTIILLASPVSIASPKPEFNLTPETAIKLILLDKMRSGDSKKNEQVNYKVDEDVLDQNNNILIRKGTPAYGTVLNSRRSGMLGRRGSLDISVEYTNAVDGQRVNLRANKERRGGGSKGLITAGALLVAWPLAFCKGSNVTIEAGTAMVAYVNDNLNIKTAQTDQSNNGIQVLDASEEASRQKVIITQSGDRISGQIQTMQNGVYTIKTLMGMLNIKETEIARIEAAADIETASQSATIKSNVRSELEKRLELLKKKKS
ncbi:MAG: hypothetical protein EOM80_14320 [Erysipelotrichia bacterium]|nr:hypothetical protein [Erysipelotrichia bacterium]